MYDAINQHIRSTLDYPIKISYISKLNKCTPKFQTTKSITKKWLIIKYFVYNIFILSLKGKYIIQSIFKIGSTFFVSMFTDTPLNPHQTGVSESGGFVHFSRGTNSTNSTNSINSTTPMESSLMNQALRL